MTSAQQSTQRWLNRYYPHFLELEALRRRIEVINDDLNRCVGSYERCEIQLNANSKEHREEMLAEVADLYDIFDSKNLALKRMDEEIINSIMKMETPMYRTVLIMRYIDRMKWKQIEKDINYSKSQVFKLHTDALDEIYPIIFGGEKNE